MFARNRSQVPAARAREARSLAGVIAAGVLVGGVATAMLGAAGGWWEPSSAAAQATQSQAGAGSKGAPAARTTATTSGKAAVGSAKAAALGVAKSTTNAAGQPARTRVSSGAVAAAGKAGSPARAGVVVQSAAHLDDQVTYQYNALGRRDPFQSLLGGEYVGSDVGGDAPPDVGGLKVVGIVWGDADQFALVEDARGDSHILRRGDKVMNGFVELLKRDAMIVNLTLDGQSQSVRVPLTRKGDKSNANR